MTTIFAQATSPGRAGVSILRISGPQARNTLTRFGCPLPPPRVATLAALKDGPTVLDRALALWFPGPNSFTGEDSVEFHLHGSPAVMQEIITILHTMEGFRLARPGEFSRRAFENGKMDLTQAEGLADLIEAETSAQARAALRQMSGELSRLYDDWRQRFVLLLAHMEAYIDFPDEPLPPELEASLTTQGRELAAAIADHLRDTRGMRLREGIYVAIVGAPNVGKSSLINALSRRDIAIVSPEAGTTRDAIETTLNIGGHAVTLCDTAGLREGAGEIESEGIARARQRAQHADIVLCMFEAGKEPDAATLVLADDRALTVVNKIDITKPGPTTHALFISTRTGHGIPELLEAIGHRAGALAGAGEAPAFTRERHRSALSQCLAALTRFLERPASIELRAEELRTAAQALGSVTGRIRIEELMDKIFSSFCIGK